MVGSLDRPLNSGSRELHLELRMTATASTKVLAASGLAAAGVGTATVLGSVALWTQAYSVLRRLELAGTGSPGSPAGGP